MRRTVSRWLIEHDPDATRRCFAQLPVGSGCRCNQCRNFDAAAGRTFPAEFVALADVLGMNPTKPAELCHYVREDSGLYLTGGWFHFVGSILSGEDALQWIEPPMIEKVKNAALALLGSRKSRVGMYREEELVPGLSIGLSAELHLVHKTFTGLPIVQLNFTTRVPWALAEPEPDS